ncbi:MULTISPECIES: DUF2062 domain-containing protein [Chromobacterium]|uniref:DUF2062 domain-containing protein n=2 Tax=Chromobacterium TaxID=535 RepID=A0A2K4MQF2_9NEIS|nr:MULTISPECIES: DUF2062 domain-containing protein [Chromobacterium]KIA79488.1 hypothetical protein QR66_15425 [Chromobacterium piscinae]MBM2883498.1 DUF2062 domain-containing protein [Chromobacterium amazonense]MDE1712369.1 DUF2062 domain-containing protein [Chromobacterium amazonense]MDQ4541789.1 DUF2062 domain-containing protein [Chromobacterium amazonense]POA99015.1 DUF2062 domain-containing protein [Chromobacterium sinusclupearum]
MTLLKRKIRAFSECRHEWFAHPALRWLAPYLDHPALWAFNRRKVAMGVAVGLYSGVMPGFTQKATALALTLLLRVNLPAAMVVSLYSNPFTVLPLYYLAYRYGRCLLGETGPATMTAPPSFFGLGPMAWLGRMLAWLAELGWPLLVGMPALGLTLGAAGYLATRVVWRWAVVSAWNNRKAKCESA